MVTAEHVVSDESQVTIRYVDHNDEKQTVTGIVKGTDRLLDIAAIEVNMDLTPLRRGEDLHTLETAKPVMSVGYSSNPPTGFPSVRVGVATTAYRVQGKIGAFETDAQFDPGDSGGAVVNLQGEVVGVSQATRKGTASGSQRVQGQQIVLSISEVEKVWDQLKRGDRMNASEQYWWHSQ